MVTVAQTSTRDDYRRLCAVLHDFFAERYWATDYSEPSRASQYQAVSQNHIAGGEGVAYASGRGNIGLMDFHLARHFPTLVKDWGANMLPRPVFSLVRNVVTSKAVAFRELVTVDLVDEMGRTLTADTLPIVGTLDRRLRETGWYSMMREKEEMAVLYRTAASHYRIIDGEMVITALAPYAYDAEAWYAAPGDPARARSISVPAGGMAYVPDPSKEPRYYYERIPGTPPTWRAALVDPDGQPMAALPEAPNGVMNTGTYPVVVWKESNSATLYCPPPQALYSAQVNVGLELINATVAVRAGGHGNLAIQQQKADAGALLRTSGMDPLNSDPSAPTQGGEVIRFPMGVQSIFQIPDGYEAQLLQSRVDPEAYAKWVQALVKLAYIQEDMAPGAMDIINPPPSNVSGKAKLYEQMPRVLAKQRREAHVREMALQDLYTWKVYWNLLAPESEQIPEGVGFRVTFSEIWGPDALADQSTVQALEGAAGMGLVDLIKLRQQIDQSTYEEAKGAYWHSAGTYKRTKAPLPDLD